MGFEKRGGEKNATSFAYIEEDCLVGELNSLPLYVSGSKINNNCITILTMMMIVINDDWR